MWKYLVVVAAIICYGHTEEYKLQVVDLSSTQAQDSSTRIIGGQDTTIEQWPFIVQLLYSSRFRCAGNLLTSKHVLSAAHCCVDSFNRPLTATDFSIRSGSTTLHSGGTMTQVASIITHESYNTPVNDNDVAVLLLQSAVTFGSSVDVARIPEQGDVVPGDAPVAYLGWGAIDAQTQSIQATTLQEVWVYKVNREECHRRYQQLVTVSGATFDITETMLCAGLLDIGGKDACSGDSGGPLVYNGVVVGIISWGAGCARPDYPGVNARVSNYTTWIINAVEQLSDEIQETTTTTSDRPEIENNGDNGNNGDGEDNGNDTDTNAPDGSSIAKRSCVLLLFVSSLGASMTVF